MLLDPATRDVIRGGQELVARWQAESGSILWADFQGLLDEADKALLREVFGLDPFTVSDIQRDRHPPKVELFDDHVFVIMTGLSAETASLDYRTLKISIVFGRRFFISQHDGVSVSTDRLWNEVDTAPRTRGLSSSTLCHRLCRNIIDRYTPIITAQEQRLDELEDAIFGERGDRSLEELVEINTRLKKLRRIFTYHRDLFDEIQDYIRDHHAGGLMDKRDLPGFRDVWDHVDRLTTFLDLFQELAVDLITGYTSVSAHNLNNIMKTLTLVTVVFLPLSLMVGIYGMNFGHMPELGWHYGYFMLLGVMACIAGGIIYLFRRKGWLSPGK